MRSAMKAAGLAGILAAALAAAAPAQPVTQPDNTDNTVREGQTVMTLLGATTSAVTYWVSRSDGWHVVTTVDAVIGQDGDAVAHAVVRFSAVLLPGQSQLISVPFPVGEPQQVLRIRRIDDQIEVARVPGSAV